jgi:flagellar motility protein MotE (MotC chaperone)
MKNIILIGLASLVLFGVAAGLSVWLQMNAAKSADAGHGDEKDSKKKKAGDDHGSGGGHADAKPTDKEHADPHKAEAKPAEAKPPAAVNKDADRVEYRRLQMEVVASDLGGQMQEYDRLLKLVGAELKLQAALQPQPDAKPEEPKKVDAAPTKVGTEVKKPTEADETEKANIARIAALADQMPADTMAGIIQQLADSGKTDTAVKVLLGMKDRTAAKVLAAITDPTIPPLLVERMQTMKRTAPAITP